MCLCVHSLYPCSDQVGKEFDALIIDTKAPQDDPVFDVFDSDTVEVSVMLKIVFIMFMEKEMETFPQLCHVSCQCTFKFPFLASYMYL